MAIASEALRHSEPGQRASASASASTAAVAASGPAAAHADEADPGATQIDSKRAKSIQHVSLAWIMCVMDLWDDLLGGLARSVVLGLAWLFGVEWLKRRYPRPFGWGRSVGGVVALTLGGATFMAVLALVFVALGYTSEQNDQGWYYFPGAFCGLFSLWCCVRARSVARQARLDGRRRGDPWISRPR